MSLNADQCEREFLTDKGWEKVEKQLVAGKDKNRWKNYENYLKKFGHCLDGAYAEIMFDVSENALVHDWTGFANYIQKNKVSKKILMEMQSGFSPEMGEAAEQKAIQANAKKYCPKKLKPFCKEIIATKFP